MASMTILDQLQTLGLRGDQYRLKMELATLLTKFGLRRERTRMGGTPTRGFVGIRYREGISALADGKIDL